MANKKKEELTLEEKTYIQNYAQERSVEQMAIVLTKPQEVIQKFAEELYPDLFKKKEEEKEKFKKSLFHQMMTPREGMAIMSPSASEVGDDVSKKNQKKLSRVAKDAIHRPLGEK